MATPRHGFTLIELSIVLVIIGLLAGGVIAGKALIEAAQIRSFVKQRERFDTAFNTFKLKYNCVPGDCVDPAALGLPGTGGDGDGFIWDGPTSHSYYAQSDQFKIVWPQLASAGLIDDPIAGGIGSNFYGHAPTVPGYHSPTCAVCNRSTFSYSGTDVLMGGWAILDGNGTTTLRCGQQVSGHFYEDYGTIPSDRLYMVVARWGALTASAAFAIDSKIDDGKPVTGRVIMIDVLTVSDLACTDDVDNIGFRLPHYNCTDWANNSYKLSNDYNDYCLNAVIKAGF